ncbi:hypothetical protein C0993_012505, partial [Termitomyces sp. T159_Od127]
DSCQPPGLVLHPPRHSSHPPALLALFHAPPPRPTLVSYTSCSSRCSVFVHTV